MVVAKAVLTVAVIIFKLIAFKTNPGRMAMAVPVFITIAIPPSSAVAPVNAGG